MATGAGETKTGSGLSFTSQGYQSKYRVVGTRPIRHDGLDKVTGRARFAADTVMPGLLYGKLLRSPHTHARILSIDASEALKMPGVRAVLTGKELPIMGRPLDLADTRANPRVVAETMLANDRVLYKGHAVAVIAATSAHAAEEALKKIRVVYEPLPAVLDLREAMKAGAPIIHEGLTTRAIAQRFDRGTDTGERGNIASHLQFKRGDLARGFAEADVIVDRELNTTMVHQGYMEPQSSTGFYAPDGKVTIWTSTQGHFQVRALTASILQLPEHQVKVIPMELGGGFGAKATTYLDPIVAMLSKKTGQPVKMTLSRKEVFEGTGPTSGAYMRARFGATREGRITAAELYLAFEAGAFPGSPVAGGATTALGPYTVENLLIDAYDVVVNKQKISSYRAPGAPHAAYAVESVIDELAEKLGMDPMDLRLKNASKEGDRLPSGMVLQRVGNIKVQQAMKAHPHYSAPLGGPNRGRGVAIGYWGNNGGPSSATLSVNANGTVNLVTGSVDVGGQRAALAMQAAEVLGVAASDVVPSVGDTDSVGFTQVSGGSRTAFASGLAVISAAQQILDQMKQRAALIWDIKPEKVTFAEGAFINTTKPEERLTFKALAARILRTGPPISATGSVSPRVWGPTFCGHIVDVEVDPETGKVDVLRYTVIQDVGQPSHPSHVESQMQGGTAQGAGWALNEGYFLSSDGTVLNSSFLDYRIPTTTDLPLIDTVLVEEPNPLHPFGIRGAGEVSIVPALAAIANAIHGAAGIRVDRQPMTPTVILAGLARKAVGEAKG